MPPSRRRILQALTSGLSVSLAGCSLADGNSDDMVTPTEPPDTVRLTVTGASVSPDETAEFAVSGGPAQSFSFDGGTPEGWDAAEMLGAPWFAPQYDVVLKSFPPIYQWEPCVEDFDGTYPIHVPKEATPGEYVLRFRVDCDCEDVCDGSATADATLTITG